MVQTHTTKPSLQHQVAHWITWLQQQHPQLVKQMRNSSHHYDHLHLNPWHLEGDVWTHTLLVLQHYAQTGTDDSCIGLTALLHDIGKPSAAKRLAHKQRVVFKGHESRSAWMAWGLLQNPSLGLTQAQKVRIFSLIALHGVLYQEPFAHRDHGLDAVLIKAAFSGFGAAFWQQLVAQNANDAAGQVTFNPQNKADLAALKDVIEDVPPRLLIGATPSPQSPSMVLMVGIPGSGKTTHIRQHYAQYRHLSRDALLLEMTNTQDYRLAWQRQEEQQLSARIDAALQQQVRDAIAARESVVIDMTNLSRNSRQKWFGLCPVDYHRQCDVLLVSDNTIWQRNRQRPVTRQLPKAVLDEMLSRFEHPLFDECDQITMIIGDG